MQACIGHDCFFPYYFQVITHRTIRHYVVPEVPELLEARLGEQQMNQMQAVSHA